jgi:hypothetical protein
VLLPRSSHGPSTASPLALEIARKKKTGYSGRDDRFAFMDMGRSFAVQGEKIRVRGAGIEAAFHSGGSETQEQLKLVLLII